MEEWPKTSPEQQGLRVPRASPEVPPNGHELRLITVAVKGSADIQDFQVAEGSTVEQLKEEAAPHFKAAKEQLLLIFAGKILKDQETLLQHGIQDGLTVYLVVKKPELRGRPSVQAPASPAGPGGRALSLLESDSEVPGGGGASSMQGLLDSSRRDLLALLALLAEVPERFQACPELMGEVLRSPAVQSVIARDCCPLAVAFVLAVSTVIGLNAASRTSRGSEKALARGVAQALERASVRDILANTKEMAQFLSESPELRLFAQETPHFGAWMSPSGLSRMVATCKKLLPLRSALAPEADLSRLGDMLDEVHAFHRLFVDIGKVFSSSEAQEELEDRLLRQVLATHPALQQLAEENAELGHLLKNPQVVADLVKYIRSPEIRREVDRHCDRTLSNLESLPGGLGVMRHMYQELEEPVWRAVQGRQQAELSAPPDGGSPGAAGVSQMPPGTENRVPLPDPWAPRLDGAPSKPPKSGGGKRSGAEDGGSHSPKRPSEAPSAAPLSLSSLGRGRCEASPRPAGSPGPETQAPGSSQGQLPSVPGAPEAPAARAGSQEPETKPSKAKAGPAPSTESQAPPQAARDGPRGSKGL